MRNPFLTLVLAGILTMMTIASASAQETDPIAVLQSGAGLQEKGDACRALAVNGKPEAIPVLEPMLLDENLSHFARYALEPMPFPEAGNALRAALGKTSGNLQVGIISSLGMRKDTQAVPSLIALLSGADAGVAQAAACALGRIATPEAIAALDTAVGQANVPPGNLLAFCNGLAACAESLQASGKQAEATAIYDRLLQVPNTATQVREGALRGAVLARGWRQGLPLLAQALSGEDSVLFAAALRTSLELDNADHVATALAGALPALSPDRKILVLDVLAELPGTVAGPPVLAEANAGAPEVRVAALRTLTAMGYGPALDVIANLAWNTEGDVAKAARDSLSYFPGKARYKVLRNMLKSADPKARVVAVELTGQGGLDEPARLLLDVAGADADETVRVAALKGLATTAGISELPGLLDRLIQAGSPDELQAAESALSALCARQKRGATGSVVIQRAIYGALPDGPSADVTEKVAEMVESGASSVDATNATFGDSAPGIVKRLLVEYTADGAPVSTTVGEGETLRFATSLTPPAVVDALCSAVDKAQGEPKLAALRLLGATGARKALDVIQTAAAQGEANVKDEAVRVLCGWPTPDALPTVMELVTAAPSDTLRVLAIRGAAQMLKQSTASPSELLGQYAALIEHANVEEKRTLLSGLAQVGDVGAFEMALRLLGDESIRAEAIQAAVIIAQSLGASAKEEQAFYNGKDLTGWTGNTAYWRIEEGAIVGQSTEALPQSEFLWSNVEVRDFYLAVNVKLEPVTGNSGVQFRSKKVNEQGKAVGYQADMGQDVWGRIYHEAGRGKLDWSDQAEPAVKPGDWNRYEILAIGPAIWLAINGKLGAACLDINADERAGLIAFQLHGGLVETVQFRIEKLVHDPKVGLGEIAVEELISRLQIPAQ